MPICPLRRRESAYSEPTPTGGASSAAQHRVATSSCEPAAPLSELDVRTFDLKRKRSLHCTHYTDGDTRRRGHALARVKEIHAACGWRFDPAELPDHLAVVLEFARRDDVQGERLLAAAQPGIELLRAALHDCGSPYALVLDAVAATLSPPDEARGEAARLAAAGPPVEDVGLHALIGLTLFAPFPFTRLVHAFSTW